MNFIISNLNTITLLFWFVFLVVIAVRFVKPSWVGNISFLKLGLIAIVLNILYGVFVTWGQYYVWSHASEMTKNLLALPLPKEVPFLSFLEWTRVFFEGSGGYFAYYIFGRVWFSIIILFMISGVLYGLFKVWNHYRGSFLEYGPELLLVLMLATGFPKILVMIPLGFILSIFAFAFYYFKGDRNIKIESMFIISSFISLIFANIILSYVL